MAFTGLLFFRPQDTIPALGALHLAELAALSAIVAMVAGRLGRGQAASRVTPELAGVVALGAIILGTAPFSIWMGGAIGTFTDLYVKVVLIFVLMVNTLNSTKRIEQFTTLIVVATAYIAFRAVLDYARGVNLVENGRVQGAVGGMFKNPNDLALNMVAVLPLAASLVLRPLRTFRRLVAATCALLMVGAVVASESRSGTIGLAVMALIFGAYLVRRKPGVALAGVLALALAVPLLPSSYWHRLSSITDDSKDETGSAEARRTLLRESWATFISHPLTGVGAGQFKNYDPDGRQQAWREAHNVVLQVAAELGLFGLLTFGFLVGRAAYAPMQVRALLRRAAARARPRRFTGFGEPPPAAPTGAAPAPLLTSSEDASLHAHAAAISAALAGWFVCALFASVAYHWTFYYLLALALAPREVLMDRVRAAGDRT
jgi:O-antigen ligase